MNSQYSANRDVAFIHVPKTGGTFVGQLETADGFVVRPMKYLGHVTVLDQNGCFEQDVATPFSRAIIVRRSDLENYIIVANVRNIFTFMVSYLHHSGGFNPRYRDPSHYDYEAANKGFDYLVRTIANRENPWPSRRFIHYTLFAQPSGMFLPSWINFTEQLDEDLKLMAANYGLEFHARGKQRASGYADYRSFYTDGLIDLVAETWKREIDLFGFEFDASKRPDRTAALRRLSEASYVWRRDELTLRSHSLIDRLKRFGRGH